MKELKALTYESYERLWGTLMDYDNINDALSIIPNLRDSFEYAEGNTGVYIDMNVIDEINRLKINHFKNTVDFDFTSSKLLWSSISFDKTINHKLQFCDRRMWADLMFNYLTDMVNERWGESKGRTVIETRLFINGNMTSEKLTRNAVSRLWWYAYLTLDNNNVDEWHLLEVLCNNTDVIASITERSISHNEKLLKRLLSYLKKEENKYLLKGDNIKALTKWLIAYGAIMELPLMSEEGFVNLLNKIKARIG